MHNLIERTELAQAFADRNGCRVSSVGQYKVRFTGGALIDKWMKWHEVEAAMNKRIELPRSTLHMRGRNLECIQRAMPAFNRITRGTHESY